MAFSAVGFPCDVICEFFFFEIEIEIACKSDTLDGGNKEWGQRHRKKSRQSSADVKSLNINEDKLYPKNKYQTVWVMDMKANNKRTLLQIKRKQI